MQGVVLSIPPPDCECRQAPSGISIDGDGYDEVCSSCVRLGTKSAVSLEAAGQLVLLFDTSEIDGLDKLGIEVDPKFKNVRLDRR